MSASLSPRHLSARFGKYPLKATMKAVIKDIDYDFPENGDPTIRIKSYDKGFKMTGKEKQKFWKKPPPGILYSEIAEEIAAANGLTPSVKPTKIRHLRVVQSNISDAQFLKELAAKAREQDGDGVTGYVFYIQDDELHFHPRELEKRPATILEYFTDLSALSRSRRVDRLEDFHPGGSSMYCRVLIPAITGETAVPVWLYVGDEITERRLAPLRKSRWL